MAKPPYSPYGTWDGDSRPPGTWSSEPPASRTTLPFSFDLEPKLRWLVSLVIGGVGSLLFLVHYLLHRSAAGAQPSGGLGGLGNGPAGVVLGLVVGIGLSYLALTWYPRIYAVVFVLLLIGSITHEGIILGPAETTVLAPSVILVIRVLPWFLSGIFPGVARNAEQHGQLRTMRAQQRYNNGQN